MATAPKGGKSTQVVPTGIISANRPPLPGSSPGVKIYHMANPIDAAGLQQDLAELTYKLEAMTKTNFYAPPIVKQLRQIIANIQ